MAMNERILVPLDLHSLSEAKIPIAMAQARARGAELILLHVCPPRRASDETISPTEAQARTFLDVLAVRLHTEGVTARPLIAWGRPAETILREIEEQQIDLVIMGATVRGGLAQALLGSVAGAVMARATCPVLLVRLPDMTTLQPPAVRSFTEDAARAGAVAPRELGLRTVEVARIIGSVGRAGELDASFRVPRPGPGGRQRFERILRLVEEGAMLPPVSLYKLGYGYYVLDGNHRVAAAKQLGQLDIDALVTEFLPLDDPDVQKVSVERAAFERATGLRRVGASVSGHYPLLERCVRAYAAAHGVDDLEDAARQWYAAVYLPLADGVRARQLRRLYPGERTADLVARVIDACGPTFNASEPIDWTCAVERLQAGRP